MNSVCLSNKCKRLVALKIAALVVTVIAVCGCSKIEGGGEGLLGGTSPNYNMLFDISANGLYLTEWKGNSGSNALIVKFQRNFCDFILTEVFTGKVTSERYSYSYAHPIATFTPYSVGKKIIKGTTKSGNILSSDEMTFTDEQNSPVLLKVLRYK